MRVLSAFKVFVITVSTAVQRLKSTRIRNLFKSTPAFITSIGAIIGVVLGIGTLVNQWHEARHTRDEIKLHLFSGDQFTERGEYEEAVNEFRTVLELDKNNIDARLRIIDALCNQLTAKAFPPTPNNQMVDIGLRRDYVGGWFAFVSRSEINDALTYLYQLEILDLALKQNGDLLLKEALILKTNSNSAAAAIGVLVKAHRLSPANSRVNAELGLLLAVPEDSQRKTEGLLLIKEAFTACLKTHVIIFT